MQKITPCLWFDMRAEEALNFYTTVFGNAKITNIKRWGKTGPGEEGSLLTANFELEGQSFIILNGGNTQMPFTEAISMFVTCKDQGEVDKYWNELTNGGQEQQCGWLKDKYGVSWQIVPQEMLDMIGDKDPARSGRAMAAMMKMKKIDVAMIREAYNQE